MTKFEPRAFLSDLFQAAVDAADPKVMLKDYVPDPPKGRLVVVGAGKASAHMARAFEEACSSPLEGLVVTRKGSAVPCERIEIVEASHPVPDEGSFEAARRMMDLVSGCGEDDLVVALMSGGGSSLLSLPPASVPPEDKQALNAALLKSGAPIHEMNAVRKHVSEIKGGRLAACAHPARVLSLIISDIPGDDPSLVASGPTVPSLPDRADALEIIERYQMDLPESVVSWMAREEAAAPRPNDPGFSRDEVKLVATAERSLLAAKQTAEAAGISAYILSDDLEGEARDVGGALAALAARCHRLGEPFKPPCVLLSGGETTVTVRHKGRGGRNTELLLSAAFKISGENRIYALAADTDGIDGSEDNAGAFIDAKTIDGLVKKGLKPKALLAGNDAYTAFEALNALFAPGPTATNVNDFRAFLILE